MPPLNCWIIEDEPPALRRLTKLIREIRPNASISFTTDTVSDALTALDQRPTPSLIFSDIQLADGLSFDIWEQSNCPSPIIFTTAYDQYSIRAFKVNSIDYLLKPIEVKDLNTAIEKAERLGGSAAKIDYGQLAQLIQRREPVYRSRFLAQYRQEWVPLKTAELRQFYSEDGLTFTLRKDGKKFLLEESLDRLAGELNPKFWFRINRAQIIHVDSVVKVSPYFNHRLVLQLAPQVPLDNIVSRSRVKECRAWLGQ